MHKTKSRDISSILQKTAKQEISKFKELPTHLVEKVVQLNFRDRHDISSTCKAFYEASYKIYEDQYWLKIDADDIFDNNSEKLRFLTNPLKDCRPRIFKNLKLCFRKSFEDIKDDDKVSDSFWKFLKHQGQNIVKLSIEGLVEADDLLKIFTFTSSIQDLTFSHLDMLPEDYDDLNLQHLESLTILNLFNCFGFDFDKLKLKQNVLKILNLRKTNYKIEDNLKEFLNSQKDLKILEIDTRYAGNIEFIGNYPEICNLEHFIFLTSRPIEDINHSAIEQFVIQQKSLKSLELDNNIWDALFLSIADNMMNLEHLSISFEHLLPENFANIEKLENLKTLKLFNTTLDQIFTSILSIKVEKLMLDYCTIIGTTAIANFTKSFPNVRILDVKEFFPIKMLFPFEEMFEKMIKLEEAKFHSVNAWTSPSFKIRSSSVVNRNLKSLVMHFPTIFKLAFFKNFPNLINFDIYIDNLDRVSMKSEIQKIFSEFKNLERVCITFIDIYRIDFDILKLIAYNPNLKIIQFINVAVDDSVFIKNVKEYKKLFDIVEVCGGIEQKSLIILLAKNEDILMKYKESYEHALKLCCNDRFYRVDMINIYKKCLKYQNVGEVVTADKF